MFSLPWMNEFDEPDEMKTTLVCYVELDGNFKADSKNKADSFFESLYKVSQEMQTEKYPEQLFIRKTLKKVKNYGFPRGM